MSKPTPKAAARPVPRPVTAAAQQAAAGAPVVTSAYLVGDCAIQHDGVLYPSGAEIALSAAQAERLGRRVTPATATQPLE